MASYHHQASFYSDVKSEYFDESKNDKVITKIIVLFITTNLKTLEKVKTTHYIDIPPPNEKFIPYKLIDHHVFRKWASMYGNAIHYQDANIDKLNDSIKEK